MIGQKPKHMTCFTYFTIPDACVFTRDAVNIEKKKLISVSVNI